MYAYRKFEDVGTPADPSVRLTDYKSTGQMNQWEIRNLDRRIAVLQFMEACEFTRGDVLGISEEANPDGSVSTIVYYKGK